MLRNVVAFFASKTSLTVALWALFVGFGILAYSTLLPREGFPSINVPISVVSGTYFVEDPELVDREMAQPILDALADRPEIESLDSTASSNFVTIIATLDEDYTSTEGAEIINQELASVALPEQAQVEARSLDVSRFLNRFDLLVGVYGPDDVSAIELEEAAAQLVPAFESQPEVVGAEVVELFRRGTDPETGDEVLIESSFNQITATSGGDAAALQFRPSVAIGLVAAPDTDALAIRDGADAGLASAYEDGLVPDGYEAKVAVDFATQIRKQISSLQGNVLTGVIAVAIVALLLISWRASIITALFIFTVLATSVGVLYLLGITLNTISLFGLILALGLFVDDAIVITESIETFREGRHSAIEIIRHAIKRVGAASISGTITTVLVFAPMLAISGILGEFIRILPLSVIVALVTSLILSLIFIPLAARFVILAARPAPAVLGGVEDWLSRQTAAGPDTRGRRGLLTAGLGILTAVAFVVVALGVFLPRVGFNIFPKAKDSTELSAEYTFPPGTTIEQAKALTGEINRAAADALGSSLVQGYTYSGSAGGAVTQFSLTDIGDRPKAPTLVAERLDPIAEQFGSENEGLRVVFSQIGAGPPEALFPFQVQIRGEDADALARAADDVAATLDGAEIERPNGTTFQVLETNIELTDVVARRDGDRYVEVQARFDGDDVSTTTAETREFLEARYGPDELAALGLPDDALQFDFGLESDNQESFASMGPAFAIALIAMLILLIIQFRSTVQWLLVFLAIPFSLFGVFGGLLLTDNELSFFVMLGLLGLIGIAVNNTILLTDFANQERRAGADRKTAISTAIRRRFRPLVATTLTTVAGVLPLALSDPFWEPLGYTIIFGLLSSTFLVLVSFPYFYLVVEWLRDRVVTPWRRKSEPTDEPRPEPEPELVGA
jgi:multidrug efflux pump subunit AcrB